MTADNDDSLKTSDFTDRGECVFLHIKRTLWRSQLWW